MYKSNSQELGQRFIESFVAEIIKSIEIKSVLLDKQRLLKAVKKIQEETLEQPGAFQDWVEEDEHPRRIDTSTTKPVPLLPNYPVINEKKKESGKEVLPPISQVQKTQQSKSSMTLKDLLTSSSGKSLLDDSLPKVNKQLMIRRQIPRTPQTMFKVPVPRIQHPLLKLQNKKIESKSKEVHPSPPTIITIEALGKINNLLLDPTVQTIECPGPGKQVTVYRSGFIQNANIFLTTEEVNKIISEISDKSKIPLIPGVFKAAISNFIITAVISEFVGTRFIIQKKEPSKLD